MLLPIEKKSGLNSSAHNKISLITIYCACAPVDSAKITFDIWARFAKGLRAFDLQYTFKRIKHFL